MRILAALFERQSKHLQDALRRHGIGLRLIASIAGQHPVNSLVLTALAERDDVIDGASGANLLIEIGEVWC